MSNERDELTDRLLRNSIGRGGAASEAVGAHVDAELLAAWVEGGLEPTPASDVERHVSSCAQCQALLGAFAATEPATTVTSAPAVVPFWHRWAVRWAIPVAAGAVGVVIWSIVRVAPPAEIGSPTQMARVEEAAPASAPPPSVGLDQERGPQPTGSDARREEKLGAAATPPARDEAGDRFGAVRQERVTPPAEASKTVEPAPAPAALAATSVPPGPPDPGAASAEARYETGRGFGGGAFRTEAGSALAVRRAGDTGPVVAQFASPMPSVVGGITAGRGGGRAGNAVADARLQAAAEPPSAQVRWRIFADGSVQRANAGADVWETIAIAPPAEVTTGSAPSPTTVWLAGRGGVVLRSTDGRTFTRVSPPASVDIVSISAVNASEARATTSDGRVFTTADGGLSWR